jgi:type II secretory pathway pseudopilin PulG
MVDRAGFRGRPTGSNLIEVIVALALLGGALVSTAGLMASGNRQVDRGGQRSQALAVAQAILEELRTWPPDGLTARLGCDGSAPACSVATGQAAAAPWQALAAAQLPAARIRVDALAVGAASLDAAPAARLAVRVAWGHGPRPRAVVLSVVRP